MSEELDPFDPFGDLEASDEERRSYKQVQLLLRVADQANRRREQLGITRTELARRLGTTKGNVTQILRGDRNLSLRKVSDLFYALESAVAVVPAPLDADTVSILNAKLNLPGKNERKTKRRASRVGEGSHSERKPPGGSARSRRRR